VCAHAQTKEQLRLLRRAIAAALNRRRRARKAATTAAAVVSNNDEISTTSAEGPTTESIPAAVTGVEVTEASAEAHTESAPMMTPLAGGARRRRAVDNATSADDVGEGEVTEDDVSIVALSSDEDGDTQTVGITVAGGDGEGEGELRF
jgi:hypothetical protein